MPDIPHQFSLPHTSVESVQWPDPTVNTRGTLADFTFPLENKRIVKFSVGFLSVSVSWSKSKRYLSFPLCEIITALVGMAYRSLLGVLTGLEVWASTSAHSGLNASLRKNVTEQNSLQPHTF